MRPQTAVEREVSRKFRAPAPTLLSRLGKSPPVQLSLVRGGAAMAERSRLSRAEDAYIVHIILRPAPTFTQLWINGREHAFTVRQGGLMIAHLENLPSVKFHTDFHFLRCRLAKETLDEMAQEALGKRSPGLRRPEFGQVDPLLFHLAASAAPLLERGAPGDQLLIDQVALTLQKRLTSAYGGAPIEIPARTQGGLAPWQERRAKDFISANLDRGISLRDIAGECGLSASHFSRAFKQSTGRTAHRWLLEQRVESSKVELKASDVPLAWIASRYGFSDPSHFSRVFSNLTGQTPAVWRRGRGGALLRGRDMADWTAGGSAA